MPRNRFLKNAVQTEGEMLEDIKASKAEKNHHYKIQGDKHWAEALSALVKCTSAQVAEADKRKIPLSDTDVVKAQAMLYLNACEQQEHFLLLSVCLALWDIPAEIYTAKSMNGLILKQLIFLNCLEIHA